MAVGAVSRYVDIAAARAPAPGVIARWGLGLAIVLAGVHKLLDPAAWTVYVDPVESLLVVSPTTFMLANGWLELAFGLAILLDRYTAVAAFVAAASLSATVAYLAAVWVATGQFGDVVARDVGLAGLAWAVTVSALRRP
ncbi:DoxX family membrane protein [Halorarius halobius]|uniref:DoxX family membrane protein n=1 Tax=Halorarius halobius TaxID=2962671 RepID=UPI0020CD6873|nr:DoxX family membrane protein [Halorarius halobius]